MLKVENLNKHFGGVHAVKDLSFYAEKNKISSIIGPNGAGKTTAFNLLTGVFECDSGSIKYNGNDITRLTMYEIAKLGIKRTFQNLQIFSNMTVLDNVVTGMHLKSRSGFVRSILNMNKKEESRLKDEAFEYLKILGLEKYASYQATSLPIGILRQMEIIRALASSPDLILMDEPAAGLNPFETDELADKIKAIGSMGITILLIEHDMNLVMRISNNVLVLNFGEKIAEGTPDEIQKNPEVIKAYLGD